MNITTQMVKELRELTGAGVLESKKALEDANGDFEKAADALKEKGAVRAAKRAEREASEGVIEVYAHPGNRVGVMVELNCESDFVAGTDQFKTLAHDLALHVAAMEPLYVNPEDIPAAVLEPLKKEMREEAMAQGKPPEIVEKIVDGKLSKYYEEVCISEQPFVKDDSIKIKELVLDAVRVLGENIIVRRFVRYELGQG